MGMDNHLFRTLSDDSDLVNPANELLLMSAPHPASWLLVSDPIYEPKRYKIKNIPKWLFLLLLFYFRQQSSGGFK